MSRTTIDIHILQTVPPSNINRDDTGSPKTAYYGGVRRARVSSQAWKRATREAFKSELDQRDLGVRTKRVVELLAAEIAAQAPDLLDTSVALAMATLKKTGKGIDLETPKAAKGTLPPPDRSKYLLFLGRHQVSRLAELAVTAERAGVAVDTKDAKSAANSDHSIDVALFGRMVADDAELNVDATAQVAHAISIHAAETEYDYFTAMDDRKGRDEDAGAEMIGTVEFTSSTLYRYATVNVDALHETLGNATATERAVRAFLRAFVTSMPTGKQNTFANRTLPDAVVTVVRDGQSVSWVGAFEEPVEATVGVGRLRIACERMSGYASEVNGAYGTTPLAGYVVRVGEATAPLDALGDTSSLDRLVDGVGELVAGRLQVTVP